MLNTYAVALLVDPTGNSATEIACKQVRAMDRYEAVAMARRLVEEQYPHVDLGRSDTWFVARRVD